MSFKHQNMHCSPLNIKREPFDSSVTIKLESLESPKKSNTMHHLTNSSANDLLKCKKRVNFSKMNYPTALTPPTSVARRNERERNRVKMVNMGFATLRQHVPNGAKNKKMSKVETLRSAVEYIRQLQRLLGQNAENSYTEEQLDQLLQLIPSSSGDENCYPSPVPSGHQHITSSPMDVNSSGEHMSYLNQMPYQSMAGAMYSPSPSEVSSKLGAYSLTSPAMINPRTSPSPSVGSDLTTSTSSPYDNNSLLDTANRQAVSVGHEDELFDFTNWF